MDDMLKVVEIKNKYRLSFTEEEKEINQHLLTYWEEMKLNELRYRFEKCWENNSLDNKDQIHYNTKYYYLTMDYKPYSIEWSRKRYLAEAIKNYFDDDASAEVVLEDIGSILYEWQQEHQSHLNKLQTIIKGISISSQP